MGVKALIYFEIVTTLALFIGWAAITISRAGVGITLPAAVETTQIQQPGQRTWQDIVLEIFPENIARSVAEAEMLQIVVFSVLFGVALAMLAGREAAADARLHREPRRDDVPLHADRDADGARSASGAAIAYTVGQLGRRHPRESLSAARDVLCRSRDLRRPRAAAGGDDRQGPDSTLRAGGRRARIDRVCDDELGSGAAAGDGSDGAVRRAAADRRVRDARPATASTSMAARCISRWRRSSWRRRPASSCRSVSSSCCC